MWIWLDDVRPAPIGYIHCKTVPEALEYIVSGVVNKISFDHDLGEDLATGYDLAKLIEEMAYYGRISKLDWAVHSANPVGYKNIVSAMENATRYWNDKK